MDVPCHLADGWVCVLLCPLRQGLMTTVETIVRDRHVVVTPKPFGAPRMPLLYSATSWALVLPRLRRAYRRQQRRVLTRVPDISSAIHFWR